MSSGDRPMGAAFRSSASCLFWAKPIGAEGARENV